MTQPALSLLSGTRILSFTQFLVGPAAVQYLSDMGADVVKVEPPGTGAWERTWSGADTFLNGTSAFYLLAHRNVRSVTLDLKHPDAREVAHRLLRTADVLVENFRPGVMERLGLDYDAVRKVNPGIVYASATGYGEDSPYRDLPGQDLIVQALSGLASVTGRSGDLPTPAGAAVVDQHCAALLALGILGALYHRARTGEGQRLHVSLLEAAVDLETEPLVYHLNGSVVQRPSGGLGSSFHPAPYGTYRTSDGYLVLSFTPVKVLSEALGNPPELQPYEDPALTTSKREEIWRVLASIFPERTTDEWVALLREHGAWCAPVSFYPQVVEDPAFKHLDPVLEMDHPDAGRVRVLRHPVRYGSGVPEVRRLPPGLGADTDEVLSELGFSEEQVARLRAGGVV